MTSTKEDFFDDHPNLRQNGNSDMNFDVIIKLTTSIISEKLEMHTS